MDIRYSYREAAVRGASAVELVVRLYEQIIEDMRQAAIAVSKNDIPLRTNRIKHAILVLGHLQSTLDFERGGKVARDLENLYESLRQRLVAVQFRPSLRSVTQISTDLLAVRAAWIKVELAERPSVTAQVMITAGVSGEQQRMDWEG
jgi:flagellar protein FliS